MDVATREAVLSIPQEDLEVATPEELAIYERALDLHAQMLSPLDYACSVSNARRFPHISLLNQWVVGLINGNLYYDGPGPDPIHVTRTNTAAPSTAMLVAGYTGDEIADIVPNNPETRQRLLDAEHGLAYDEDGLFILMHPTRGDRPVYNVAFSMPPRHGKSYLVSEHLPAWFLSNYPEYSVLLASYEQTFAGEWGEKVRDHIVDHPEFGVDVVGGKNSSKTNFNLVGTRGFMKCAGAGGPLTGKGGHLMICDDPIKNAKDALSELMRKDNDDWWKTTFYTRREPWADGTPGRVILMSTRWHEDDLHGRRIPKPPTEGSRWAQLNLMAVFEPTAEEPTDPIGRKPGQALCPSRVPLRELRELRQDDSEGMGEMWFQALYQGHPSLEEGNVVKRPFFYYTSTTNDRDQTVYELHDPNGDTQYINADQCYRFGTLDMAASDKKHADWTVLLIFDITPTNPRRLILVGMERIRITVEHHEEHVQQWYKKWNLRMLAIENKTFGTNLIARLQKAGGMILRKLSGDTQQLMRVMPVQYEVRNQNIWFPKNAEWLSEVEAELTKYPNARHDDILDCVCYGVEILQDYPMIRFPKPIPVTMEEKVQAHKEKLLRRRKRKGRARVYPGIGQF